MDAADRSCRDITKEIPIASSLVLNDVERKLMEKTSVSSSTTIFLAAIALRVVPVKSKTSSVR